MLEKLLSVALLLTDQAGHSLNSRKESHPFEPGGPPTLEVVYVTAQKRKEPVHEVPISISAFSGELLEQANISNLVDIAPLTPGFEARSAAIQTSLLTIRGITTEVVTGSASTDPRISVYQDGVSISRGPGAVVELFDVERVEVLKGPQGALFGRSAEVGAIQIIQNKAHNEREAGFYFARGELDYVEFRGMVNAPLNKETLFGRFAGVYKRRDGYLSNTEGLDPYAVDRIALRGIVTYEPSNALRFDLIANYQKDAAAAGTPENSVLPAVNGERDLGRVASMKPFGPGSGLSDFVSPRDLYDVALLTNWQVSEQWHLDSISAIRSYDSTWYTDEDGTAFDLFAVTGFRDGDQWSQELRAVYQSEGRISGFAGASFIHEEVFEGFDEEVDERQLLAFLDPANIPVFLSGDPQSLAPIITSLPLSLANAYFLEQFRDTNENDGFDFFAEVAVDLMPELNLLIGGRWSREEKTSKLRGGAAQVPSTIGALGILNEGVPSQTLFLPDIGFEDQVRSEDFDGFTWRTAFKWTPRRDLNLWASYARGRRPEVIAGVFDGPAFGGFSTAPAETVDSYEIGTSWRPSDGRVKLDSSIYHYFYENFQSLIFEGGTFQTVTSGLASANGFEGQVALAVTNNLTLFGNYAYIRARFDDRDQAGRPQVFGDNTFRFSPDHTFAVGAKWRGRLPGSWTFRATPIYSWQSEIFFDERNLPNFGQEAYGLLNINFVIGPDGAAWKITAAVENVLDETYAIMGGALSTAFGIPALYTGPPRLWRAGVEINF